MQKRQKMPEEQKERQRLKNIGDKNPFYGQLHSRRTLDNLTYINMGDKNPVYGKPGLSGKDCPLWRGGKLGTLCSYCGNIIERYPSEIGSHNFCCDICRGHNNSNTNIEILMQIALTKAGYNFETQVHILSYYPDILLTDYNIIIECDGDYWHGNEKVLKDLEDWHYDTWIDDSIRDRKLGKAGYTVMRFWETDIENDIERCMRQITLNINLKSNKEQYNGK